MDGSNGASVHRGLRVGEIGQFVRFALIRRLRPLPSRRAGIAPTSTDLNGTDPVTYIIAANVHRRHLSKGQLAMVVARIYPTPQQGKAGASLVSKEVGISEARLSQARLVLRVTPSVADRVMAGTLALDAAFKAA